MARVIDGILVALERARHDSERRAATGAGLRRPVADQAIMGRLAAEGAISALTRMFPLRWVMGTVIIPGRPAYAIKDLAYGDMAAETMVSGARCQSDARHAVAGGGAGGRTLRPRLTPDDRDGDGISAAPTTSGTASTSAWCWGVSAGRPMSRAWPSRRRGFPGRHRHHDAAVR